MAKAIDDRGHLVATTRPLQIKRYEAGKLPDPGQCTDCLIIINDRSDGVPRARLAMSNGASWDHIAWRDELRPVSAPAPPVINAPIAQPQIDLMPMIREAVAAAIRDRSEAPMRVIDATPQKLAKVDADMAIVSDAMLTMAEHVNSIQLKNAELMARDDELIARVEFLEQNALAKVNIA